MLSRVVQRLSRSRWLCLKLIARGCAEWRNGVGYQMERVCFPILIKPLSVIFGANGFFGYAYTNSTASSPAEHGDKAVWWSTYSLKDCPADWRHTDLDDARTQLQGRHGTWKNKTVQRILSDVEITSVYPTFTTPLLPTWERNGCVLIGDAAHALQPSSGQGGSMALEDCEALALLLHYDLQQDAEKGHMIATKQYSELRMPRLGMVHKKAQETGAMKQDMGLVQEMVMYFFIWLMSKSRHSVQHNLLLGRSRCTDESTSPFLSERYLQSHLVRLRWPK